MQLKLIFHSNKNFNPFHAPANTILEKISTWKKKQRGRKKPRVKWGVENYSQLFFSLTNDCSLIYVHLFTIKECLYAKQKSMLIPFTLERAPCTSKKSFFSLRLMEFSFVIKL